MRWVLFGITLLILAGLASGTVAAHYFYPYQIRGLSELQGSELTVAALGMLAQGLFTE